jgi:type III pantothenate kinase
MSATVLAIDCGNTRLKWGLHDGARWRTTDVLPLGSILRLEVQWRDLEAPTHVIVSNVAGEALASEIAKLVARWPTAPTWIRARRSACGVTNGYEAPERLGSDRWAALIAARSLHPGPALIVSAGTTTTADMLTREGVFTGGVILPGVDLMKRSLAQSTAQLALAQGRVVEAPRNTEDAVETGCLLAQAGAIERMHALLGPEALCLISGGDAARIAAALRISAKVVDNLVLEGLLHLVE